jgi:hypothetical protein
MALGAWKIWCGMFCLARQFLPGARGPETQVFRLIGAVKTGTGFAITGSAT